jgi:hypothetical protein
MAFFTGCAGTGSSSGTDFVTATNEEISAVEGSLLLDRVLAAETIGVTSADVLASTLGSTGTMRYRNRLYKAENRGNSFGISRGTGSCIALVSTDTLVLGAEQATVEKLTSGAIKITRGNGTVIETPTPSSTGEISSFVVDGIEWQATFGSASTDPLVTLKNTRSGMILQVTELDDGSITIIRDSSEVFTGRWSEDGSLQLNDGQGKMYRYRYGKNSL